MMWFQMEKPRVTLITHNKNKIKEFKSVLEPEVEVEVLELEYPELRSDEAEEIVKLAAKQLAEKTGKRVVVEDSGFHIKALSGFPGTCTAYVHKRIGNRGFLKLMEGVKNREVFYKSAIGLCSPGGTPVVFTGVERGRMSLKERGMNGWGQDPIFIPEGKRKTYGETRKPGDVNRFRYMALAKLKEYLLNDTTPDSH
ncbi:non-canonical purine NTP pyrophosphatase [Candidatus Woesearchaeota archaeon]|nr:MAG: non-canonical purine NTP pyrophosphatase [Candidatus Woesearchaeota archaeon]